jgi:hypothetical protein
MALKLHNISVSQSIGKSVQRDVYHLGGTLGTQNFAANNKYHLFSALIAQRR